MSLDLLRSVFDYVLTLANVTLNFAAPNKFASTFFLHCFNERFVSSAATQKITSVHIATCLIAFSP